MLLTLREKHCVCIVPFSLVSYMCVCDVARAVEAKKLSPEEAAGLTIGLVLMGFFAAIIYFAINTRNLREEAKEKRLMSEAVRVRSDMNMDRQMQRVYKCVHA